MDSQQATQRDNRGKFKYIESVYILLQSFENELLAKEYLLETNNGNPFTNVIT